MEMYLRVKRYKTTVFLECTGKNKLEELRIKLAGILKEDPATLRFQGAEGILYPEQKTVSELGLQNEAVIFVVSKLPDGTWDTVNIPPPEIMEDDEDEDAED